MALLWSQDVPQDADCQTGPLWVNCNNTELDIVDSDTHQVFENEDGEFNIGADCAAISFHVSSSDYVFSPTRVESLTLNFKIEIVTVAASNYRRQNTLDVIQGRIIQRIVNHPVFTDAQTGEVLRSFMRWADENTLTMSVSDDSSFDGNYTVRELAFTLRTNECISKGDCSDTPLCFNFEHLSDGVC